MLLQRIKEKYSEPQGYREILIVALPLIVSMGSATIMEFTDRVFLTYYSINDIAAAVPASFASLTGTLTVMGICSYATILIAQYVGAGANHRVGSALWQGIWVAVCGGLVLAASSFVAPTIFAFSGHDEVIQKLEVSYYRILVTGSIFILLQSTFADFFTGRGQTRIVMIANLFAIFVNIPLDYILIFGAFGSPPLGIVGAGLATTFGWALGACILGVYIFTKDNEKIYKVRSDWAFEWNMFKRLFKYGVPNSINLFIELVVPTWLFFQIGKLGSTPLAASNIVISINSIIFTPMLGISMAVAALVGQSIGTGATNHVSRYTQNTLHLSLAYMVPLICLIILIPESLIRLFLSNDVSATEVHELIQLGTGALYFVAIFSLADAYSLVYFGALKGAGDTLGVTGLIVVSAVLFLIIPFYMLKMYSYVSLYRYWFFYTLYTVFLAIASTWRFRKGKWKNIHVIEQNNTLDK